MMRKCGCGSRRIGVWRSWLNKNKRKWVQKWLSTWNGCELKIKLVFYCVCGICSPSIIKLKKGFGAEWCLCFQYIMGGVWWYLFLIFFDTTHCFFVTWLKWWVRRCHKSRRCLTQDVMTSYIYGGLVMTS